MAELAITVILILLSIVLGKGFIKLNLRQLVVIALIIAISSSGRFFLAAIPDVKPTTYLIIMCGIVFGPAAGYFSGVLTALMSSLLVGVGPWTIWQMLCWGLIGAIAPILKNKSKLTFIIFGVLSSYIFGWVMNLWIISAGTVVATVPAFITLCVTSFIFDTAHALTTATLLIALPLERFKKLFKIKSIVDD